MVFKSASSKSTANVTLRQLFGPSPTFEVWVNRLEESEICLQWHPQHYWHTHRMGVVEFACPLLLVSSASAQPNKHLWQDWVSLLVFGFNSHCEFDLDGSWFCKTKAEKTFSICFLSSCEIDVCTPKPTCTWASEHLHAVICLNIQVYNPDYFPTIFQVLRVWIWGF